jgi:hypothetical protein
MEHRRPPPKLTSNPAQLRPHVGPHPPAGAPPAARRPARGRLRPLRSGVLLQNAHCEPILLRPDFGFRQPKRYTGHSHPASCQPSLAAAGKESSLTLCPGSLFAGSRVCFSECKFISIRASAAPHYTLTSLSLYLSGSLYLSSFNECWIRLLGTTQLSSHASDRRCPGRWQASLSAPSRRGHPSGRGVGCLRGRRHAQPNEHTTRMRGVSLSLGEN